jgi:hypothetical protein
MAFVSVRVNEDGAVEEAAPVQFEAFSNLRRGIDDCCVNIEARESGVGSLFEAPPWVQIPADFLFDCRS